MIQVFHNKSLQTNIAYPKDVEMIVKEMPSLFVVIFNNEYYFRLR